MMIRLLSGLLLALWLCGPVSAQQAQQKRLALVVGNSAYSDAPLRNPANDARLISQTLAKLDFEVIERIDADLDSMKRAIIEFGDKLEKGGGDIVGLFYYAGHGVQVGGANYLIPIGAQINREKDMELEAVNANWVLDQMDYAENAMNIVILDACRNNPFKTRSFRSTNSGLARMDAPRGSLIAYATAPGDVAADGNGLNSPYTEALARAMTQPDLPVERMFKEVRKQVSGGSAIGQTPWESSSLVGEFYFNADAQAVSVDIAPDTRDEAAARAWAGIQNSTNPTDFKDWLAAYEGTAFTDLARARMAALQDGGAGVSGTGTRSRDELTPLQRDFAAVLKAGGLVADPSIPEELYHNARIYELRGDYGNARRTYLKYLAADHGYLDPHLRFSTFLKVQEGRAGAREVYQALANQTKAEMHRYALVLLGNREQRIKGLQATIETSPDFAPAWFHLSQEYSLDRLGQQTLSDKRNEKKYLDGFVEKDRAGNLVRYFIDQELVAEMREDARRRLAALGSIAEEVLENPVQITGMLTNQGWMLNVNIADQAEWIQYRLGEAGDYRNTGQSPMRNQMTGRQMALTSIDAGRLDGPTTVFIKYTDLKGETHGPFEILFNPGAAVLDSQKMILNMTRSSWVSFRLYEGQMLAYFTHLMSNRGVLKEIWYGLDKDEPDKRYSFPPHDSYTTASITTDVPIYMRVDPNTKFITVKLVYKDETVSEVVRIDNPQAK